MEKHLSQTQCIGLNSDLTSKKKTTSCLSFPDCKMTRTECLSPPPATSSVEGVNGKAGCGGATARGHGLCQGDPLLLLTASHVPALPQPCPPLAPSILRSRRAKEPAKWEGDPEGVKSEVVLGGEQARECQVVCAH